MIGWHKEGKFPIEKLIKHYSVRTVARRGDWILTLLSRAILRLLVEDTLAGRTIKPFVVWDQLTHNSFKPKSVI